MVSAILAKLERSLQPGQLTYVELSFASQAGVDMHESPLGIGRTQFLGFARVERPIVRTYPLQDILINEAGKQEIYSREGIDFFARYVIGNDDNKWRKPLEHYKFKLDVTHLPDLQIWGKMSADERSRKYIRQNIDLLARLQKRDTSAFGIIVHTNRDDIVEVLTKHPYESAQAFDLLESDLPDKIRLAGHVKAIEDITSFYREFVRENISISTLENKFKFLKTKDVGSFVEKFELIPGVILNVKEFLGGAEEKLKKERNDLNSLMDEEKTIN